LGDARFALIHPVTGLLPLQPRFRHGTFDDVPLNSSALRAGKRSQIVPDIARLNCRQLHGRAASRALRALVLCIEHALLLSVRRSELTSEPTGRFRFQRVRCNDAYLDVIAFRAFEQPLFETNRSR
jgi:hypothetical protein